MARLLKERGKDQSIDIKWGSLYTVVGNLERHGLIEAAETVREGRRPERTVYRITQSGQAEMQDWLRELIGTPEKEYPRFEAALSLLPGLSPDEVEGLLAQRLNTLDAELGRQERMLAEWRQRLPRLFLIESEYAVAMLRAEADWVRSLLYEFREGSFPGLGLWREFHETGELPREFAELAEGGDYPDR
jgi:DNA-binding PadR family transcriptional regulator